jgi:hypothetical protein
VPMSLPGTQNVLDEYFKGSDDWREYKTHTRKVREYRNAIVHNVQIGRTIVVGNIVLVPKKEQIQDYKKSSSIFAATEDIRRLESHFTDMREQMTLDIQTLEVILNKLWDRLICDMKRLFFDDENAIMLGKYRINST